MIAPMDVVEARAVLGVASSTGWDDVRAAYKRLIRAAHPDVAGPAASQHAARVNAAYTVLARARRGGTLHPPAVPPQPRTPPVSAVPVEVLDGDTIHLDCPSDEAFARLIEAAHTIGEITYVDRSCAIFEAIVPIIGEGACSLVISLQGRAEGTDAFCTLEAIEHVAQPPVRHVTAALVAALRAATRDPGPRQ